MKKYLLTAVMLFTASLCTFAADRGYEGFGRIRVAPDISYSETFVGLSFTNGYRFNDYFFLGGGMGFDVAAYDDYTRIGTGSNYEELCDYSQLVMSIFATLKVNMTDSKVSPFFATDLGVASEMIEDYDGSVYYGLFITPAFGVDINLGESQKRAVFFQLGLNVMENDNLLTWELESKPRCKVSLEAGFRF